MEDQSVESKTYPLSGGFYTIKRIRQIFPHEGDDVKVLCRIILPCAEGTSSLRKDLIFETRHKVLGEPLTFAWGYKYEANYRAKNFCINYPTWKQCFDLAHVIASKELELLEEKIHVRMKALEEAEKE